MLDWQLRRATPGGGQCLFLCPHQLPQPRAGSGAGLTPRYAHGPRLSGGSFGNGNLCASRCANSGAFCRASGAERHGASAQVAAIRRQQPPIGRGTGNSAAGTSTLQVVQSKLQLREAATALEVSLLFLKSLLIKVRSHCASVQQTREETDLSLTSLSVKQATKTSKKDDGKCERYILMFLNTSFLQAPPHPPQPL